MLSRLACLLVPFLSWRWLILQLRWFTLFAGCAEMVVFPINKHHLLYIDLHTNYCRSGNFVLKFFLCYIFVWFNFCRWAYWRKLNKLNALNTPPCSFGFLKKCHAAVAAPADWYTCQLHVQKNTICGLYFLDASADSDCIYSLQLASSLGCI